MNYNAGRVASQACQDPTRQNEGAHGAQYTHDCYVSRQGYPSRRSGAPPLRKATGGKRPFDSEQDAGIETDPWNLTRRRARRCDGDRREAEPVETGGGSAAILTGPALLFT